MFLIQSVLCLSKELVLTNSSVLIIDIMMQLLSGEGNLKTHLASSSVTNHPKRGMIQANCYGLCRYYYQLEWILLQLVVKKPKKQKLVLVLMLGLFQLRFSERPEHAVVKSSVDLLVKLKLVWAKGLVNGVLRNYLRQQDDLNKQLTSSTPLATSPDLLGGSSTESSSRFAGQAGESSGSESEEYAVLSHPQWLIDQLKQAWPKQYTNICCQNNQHPPMTLRINQAKTSVQDYLSLLDSHSICYQSENETVTFDIPMGVEEIPGFKQGLVSVQDSSAQQAAKLIDLSAGMTVLDACAAPGGKTAHMLELQPELTLTAVDIEQSRLDKVAQNLKRLDLSAHLLCADATKPDSWWDGQAFDRILLDAPCSATGVIRRQPDVKLLLKPEDTDRLCQIQFNLLTQLWALLKPGGKLLYATCSVLPQENEKQIKRFLSTHEDALNYPIDSSETNLGLQLFPATGDGFYYALLGKKND